ncbi:endo-beta-glucanase [Russula emetica]|nr:endo-beta-glucanase [Russula emetica]
MKFISSSTVALAILLAGRVHAATYQLNDTFQGDSFFSGFSFLTQNDPMHGRVNYVTEEEARSRGLAVVEGSSFILRADDTTMLSPGGKGRDSFRIMSNNRYDTHVIVFDVQHMPQGCGTGTTILELGDNWPYGGEVDVLEGVNDQEPNVSSLHTSPGCTMPEVRMETGDPAGLDCNAFADSVTNTGSKPNTGCDELGTFFFLPSRTPTFIKIWFWPRDAYNVPSDVENSNSGWIDTDAWGTPTAYFPDTECDIYDKFSPSTIIIDLTFCGKRAGNDYSISGCPGTCEDFVNNKPAAFSEAYFEFNSLRVYQ